MKIRDFLPLESNLIIKLHKYIANPFGPMKRSNSAPILQVKGSWTKFIEWKEGNTLPKERTKKSKEPGVYL